MLSPTKRISCTFHGARHAPWHHRGRVDAESHKGKVQRQEEVQREGGVGPDEERKTNEEDAASRAGRERSSASVAGKNSGRCYSWCELSRSGFIMQQHERHSLLSLRLCASACPPGSDVPDLSRDGENWKFKIRQIYECNIKLIQVE